MTFFSPVLRGTFEAIRFL